MCTEHSYHCIILGKPFKYNALYFILQLFTLSKKKKCLRVIYPLRKRHSEWNSGSFDTLTHTISIRIFDLAIQLSLRKIPPEQSDFFCIYIILSFKKYSYPILEKKKLDFPYYTIPWHTTITVSLAQKQV